MSLNPVWQMTLGKLRELLREPEALFWVFVFPVLLALGLGIAFRSAPPETLPVGVQASPRAEWARAALDDDAALQATIVTPEQARRQLRIGALALVAIEPEAGSDDWTYWFDPTRAESQLAQATVDRALQRASGRVDAYAPAVREMTEKGSRYIDFLIPGLLGMNLMGTGMWGIGFYVVSSRANGLLKRMIATPMKKSHFMFAQLAGRMLFLIGEVGVLIGFAHFVFDVPIRGSIVVLALLSLFGAAMFSGIGMLVAARPRTIEGVSGLMNFVMMPMWIMSGTFFSTERFPDLIQPAIQLLPLTALNDALRAVMLEGASPVGIAGELAIIGFWTVVSYALALWLFRWK